MAAGKAHIASIEAMIELQKLDDEEVAHVKADKILCDFLITLGYSVLVDEYNKIKNGMLDLINQSV